jgi:hypothetical protein
MYGLGFSVSSPIPFVGPVGRCRGVEHSRGWEKIMTDLAPTPISGAPVPGAAGG